MDNSRIWKVSTLVLAAALVWSLAGGVRPASAEPQPMMRAAVEFLHKAKASLERATADKGGHRVKAIGLIGQAIGEVQAGIKFDSKH
ncbi:MAG: hypothetical protein EXR79_01710 [Myxococcales bacterium]|nr:hypothetical protein [Myxococcales bacterium]